MKYRRFLKINAIFFILALLIPAMTVDCAGRLRDTKSSETLLVPGGLDTDNGEAKKNFKIAWQSMQQKKFEEAVFFFQLALGTDPDFPQAYYGLGLSHMKMGRFQEALAFLDLGYQKGKSNEPFTREVLLVRNECLTETIKMLESRAKKALEEKQWSEAIVFLRNGLTFQPESVELRILLAEALYNHHDYTESLELFRSVFASNPASTKAFNGLLKNYIALKDYDTARDLIYSGKLQGQQDDEYILLKRHIDHQFNILTMPREYRLAFEKPSITRGDLAIMLANVPGIDKIKPNNPASDTPKTVLDISNHWAKPFILILMQKGIMNIYANNTFRPDKYVKRYELAEIILRIMSGFIPENSWDESEFTVADVSPFSPSYQAVQCVLKFGFMSLDRNNRFHQHQFVSGAEVKQIIDKLKMFLISTPKKTEENYAHM